MHIYWKTSPNGTRTDRIGQMKKTRLGMKYQVEGQIMKHLDLNTCANITHGTCTQSGHSLFERGSSA